jgi:PAS domain S-box-containing protein
MAQKKSVRNQDDLFFDSSRKFEIYSLITEKISQLGDLRKILDEVLAILKTVMGCRHLAIRMIDSKGNIPFSAHVGLDKKFLDSEHWITVRDCLCGHVARGAVDKSWPFITENGSFFTNSLPQLLAEVKVNYAKIDSGSLRDACLSRGYESVAIVPVRAKGKIIAELYLSDEKKGLFPVEKVRFLEDVSVQVGIAIQNSQLYTQLNDSQRRLMDLFNSTSMGILDLDTKGYILQVNNKGAELLGYSSPEKLLDQGIKISELNVEKEGWEGFIESVDESGAMNNFLLAFRIGRGKQFLEFSLISVKDSKGNITGYRGTFRDVTDRIRLEEERLNKAKTESLKNRYYQEALALRDEIKSEYPFEEMIGVSPAMQQIKKAIQQVAPTDTTVLIKGETGTGKELVARYIHELSLRKDRILVKVNCAALSEGLITSELFGHEKGAFTGAIQRRVGRFEYADNATIFLDEIGDLPLETQAMLLRVLQDGEFERVGSSKTIKVDVRLIAATNRDLMLLVNEKRFRQDLYFRLNVFSLEISPLREKKEDIPLLTAYFLDTMGRRVGKKVDKVSEDTMKLFMEYAWPGNVRELQNIIEHGLVISRGDSFEIPRAYFGQVLEQKRKPELISLEEFEKKYILEVLQQTKGAIYGPKGAAVILGLKPSTLQSRMKKLGVERPKTR